MNTPSWLKDDEEPPRGSTTIVSMNNDEALPNWAVDVERQAQPASPNANDLVVVTVGTETAAPANTNNNVNTGTANATNGSRSAAETAAATTWGEYFWGIFQRDGRLLLITIAVIIAMNIPVIKWVMYPFSIFSTWIHEFCHGMAAVLAGGKVYKLEIFPDTSGLATTSVPSNRRGFVASAGYQGTAVVGCLLLIFRRTKRGPRTGCMGMAVAMLLSVMLWVRNGFGIGMILLLGVFLAAAAWRLPSFWMRNVYVCMAVTTCLNAITSVQELFGSNHMVNGQETGTDATSMAEIKGTSSVLWATLWLILALVLTTLGFLFAIPGPDEVADFTCCGVCQDLGLFRCCNAPGKRLFRQLYGGSTTDSGNTTTNNNNNNNSPNNGTVNG